MRPRALVWATANDAAARHRGRRNSWRLEPYEAYGEADEAATEGHHRPGARSRAGAGLPSIS
jgi:hypothetical protein